MRGLQDLSDWNSKDRDALLAQPFVAGDIARRCTSHIVRDTVDLDTELRGGAVEIEHVWAERVLAAELDARLLPQFLPYQDFGQRHLLA